MAASSARVSEVTGASELELVFTRVFDAPRELVFELWTDPKHITHWWGPHGFRTTISEMDVRPGGVWRFVMHGPDGVDYKNRVVFLEVVKPERLVYKHDPEEGCEPITFQKSVTFAEDGGKTRLTMRLLFPSIQMRDHVIQKYGAVEGANQTLERFGEQLAKVAAARHGDASEQGVRREIVMSRIFDGPREVVFEAWTRPEHLARWFGPRGFTLPACKMEFRTGGTYRYCMRSPEGRDYWCEGVYVEIVAPERIVHTGYLDIEAGREIRTTITFTEQDGKTKLTVQQSFLDSETMRGVDQGWAETLDRLAVYVAENSGGKFA